MDSIHEFIIGEVVPYCSFVYSLILLFAVFILIWTSTYKFHHVQYIKDSEANRKSTANVDRRNSQKLAYSKVDNSEYHSKIVYKV